MKKKILWLLVSCLMVASLVLASCAPAAPPEEEKPLPTSEEPSYGGWFRYGLNRPVLGFDEAFTWPTECHSLMHTNEDLSEGNWAKGLAGTGEWTWKLGMFAPVDFVTGTLAESWEIDVNTFTIHIRKGVHFALNAESEASQLVNGREMTADDVVYSINRYFESPMAFLHNNYPPPVSLTATDKWTVVMEVPEGKAGVYLEVVVDIAKIVPHEVVEKYGDMKDWRVSCGTGPFMLTENVEGSSMTLVKNPNYWMKDPLHPKNQLPYLDGVKYLIIPDQSTRFAALRTAKIDHDWNIAWEDAESLKSTNPELKWDRALANAELIFMRVDKPEIPLYDLRVRQALNMAVDKQEIARAYFGGNAEVLAHPTGPMPEFKLVYTPLNELPESSRELYEYHPDKARQLLAEAGYPDGFKTEVVCQQGNVDLLSIVKDYWSKIGVDLELDIKEPGVYTSIRGSGTHEQMFIMGLGINPYRLLEFRQGHIYNLSKQTDPYIKEQLDLMDEYYFDYPKKSQILKELTKYIIAQSYYVQLPAPYVYTFWQPWVMGYHGEVLTGYANNYAGWIKYIWIDQNLKEQMTGQ